MSAPLLNTLPTTANLRLLMAREQERLEGSLCRELTRDEASAFSIAYYAGYEAALREWNRYLRAELDSMPPVGVSASMPAWPRPLASDNAPSGAQSP